MKIKKERSSYIDCRAPGPSFTWVRPGTRLCLYAFVWGNGGYRISLQVILDNTVKGGRWWRGVKFPAFPFFFFQIYFRGLLIMAKENGWIKVYRDIRSHWLWKIKPFSKGQAWIDLILQADFQEKTIPFGNSFLKIERGEIVTSEIKLMDAWGWSKSKVRAFLKLIQKDSMVDLKSDRKKTTIKVVKYGVYQDKETTEEPQKDHRKTTEEPQKDTNKKGKNAKNEKKEIKEYTPQVKFLVDQVYFQTLTEVQQNILGQYRQEYYECCRKLLELKPSYKEEEIRKAINWARNDSFWAGNFMSFSKLRKKNKEGIPYIEVFLEKARGKDSQRKQKPLAEEMPEDYYTKFQVEEG